MKPPKEIYLPKGFVVWEKCREIIYKYVIKTKSEFKTDIKYLHSDEAVPIEKCKMNFNKWREKYFPDLTDEDTLHKMSLAWASGHVNMASNSVPREQYDRVVGLLADTYSSISDDQMTQEWFDEVGEIIKPEGE